ncbi:MAG: ammonia-forming cytochrome c nitrite reductase subunit c552, partial [Bacteroidaceae bacterium]|nr:ammonia-forming cytochrome c nitrite reductase subunit c552 [Bacteroidaceae bacterium]
MAQQLKRWQGWLLFGGTMVVVFVLGLVASSLLERRAEVVSIYNNRKHMFKDEIVAQNEKFAEDFPREYQTWLQTKDTTYRGEFNSSNNDDVLAARPEMVVLWAGYAFSWEYNQPRGHQHAIEDLKEILRTGAPGVDGINDNQPGTCWTCKGPDVPRLMKEKGIANFYKAPWSQWGDEVVNPIGCADCHDSRTMNIRPARPSLTEAWERRGQDVSKQSHQEMRSLVCAQCHTEYYFKGEDKYLTYPHDKGMTVEAIEAYFDEMDYKDYTHTLSRAPILKAQHPDYELWKMGIHGQRGVSCADCHMPYVSEGGIKYSDHQIVSPLAKIDKTCQTCHREDAEVLRQ